MNRELDGYDAARSQAIMFAPAEHRSMIRVCGSWPGHRSA